MPLHGKIVVVKRSGGDGTEFPITAACLFGRKPDCDIRIQLPQVSKEHCRIDLNENKEVILTNLSSVNPTRVNGKVLQQSERLKHGDVITIIDRSFRFEYPPAPTPKKRSSIGGKSETFKVLQDQQVGDAASTESGDKRISEVSTDPHLKDGTNHDNIQRSLEKPVELELKEDGGAQQKQTISPFNDLYQMIKKSLDVKTPRKSSVSVFQTPTSRFCTPKPGTVEKNGRKSVVSAEGKDTPKKDGAAENTSSGTPKSVKKQRKSLEAPSAEATEPEAENAGKSETTSPQTRNRTTPQRFSVSEVVELVSAETPKSPMRRRSKEATPVKPAVTKEQEKQSETSSKTLRKASPRNSGKVDTVKVTSKKRKSGELAADLPSSQMKKKRVSFGGLLNPELFDKRLPPDSPLRKGDAPRRSLCVQRPKQSLLRRASAIGLLQEFEQNRPGSPKVQSPARTKTPSPKKSPKSRSPSPKAATPAKKSPKSATATPKAAKTPKSRSPSPKAATPAKTPKSRSPSPKAATPAKTPKSRSPSPKVRSPKSTPSARARSPSSSKAETPVFQTPTVRGRFSVSRISTPSPVAEDAVTDQVSLNTATPKISLRRKSMKSSARKTPSAMKSAVKAIHRRSGISRASMKAFISYADMVKFGQMKTQTAAAVAAKKPAAKKTVKKVVAKLQTPARKVKGHVSTGHANSPATIVLGRAQGRTVVPPTGGAPKLVANIALLKKNMKMDEDLTGISEMYKTPVNQKKRRSVVDSAMNTPVGALGTSTVEPSVLNTPEEPGEMMVSPLSVSAVKDRHYNSEAVSRLLHGHQECVPVSDVPAAETEADDSSEQQRSDLTASVTTPKQKPELPECLTGVKRLMRTPRQKPEPVEDLRGRLLKTPKQKLEQQECLTGVKRIMRTPRQKAEPVEDLRGKILKTPKQKLEQQECLTGVKRLLQTPQQEAEPLEDLPGAILETPIAPEFDDDGSDGVEETAETAARMTNPTTPDAKSSPPECLTGVKRLMKTPREKSAPVEDMVGVKRLMKTPRDVAEPVEENFGIKRLMKSPRLRGNAPVEDFEGLQELMEEPVSESTGPQETEEVEDQSAPICGADVPKELDFVHEDPQDDEPSDVMGADMEKGADEVVDDHSEAAVDENLPVEEPKQTEVSETATAPEHGLALETVPQAPTTETSPEVETATCEVAEMDEPVVQKKPVRGRRAKTAETKPAEEKREATEPSEEPVVSAPVRGRRGKKTEAAAPPAVRQTKGTRNAKTAESGDVEVTEEKVAPRPKRGRAAKKASDDQAETAQEVVAETELAPEPEREQVPPVDPDHTAPVEKAVLKPKRGRKPKLPEPTGTEQQDVSGPHSDDVPQPGESDAKEVCSDLLDVVPSGSEENKSSDAMETVPQAPAIESSPEAETTTCEVVEMDEPAVQKKPGRGRRAKVVEAESAEEKREAPEPSEEPVVPAPVRGRRGKKTEAAAPPAVRQTKRGRNAKSQESTSDDQPETVVEKAAEPTSVTEISAEAEASDLTSSVNTHQEEDSAAPAEEAVVKPIRGRKTKQTRAEPPKPEPDDEEVVSEEAQPQKAAPAVEKPRRGRRAKPEAVDQNEVAEDTVVAVETKQQSRPPARAKRGRNAKHEEEKPEKDAETTESQEPVEAVVPEEAEAPLVAEPAAKPRRGGRKTKQDAERETAVDSVEAQEVSAATSTDKPKRGRRGKQVTEEAEVAAAAPEEKPDHEVDAEEETKAEPDAPAVKSGRAKRAKNEDSQDIAAKRTRRGAAPSLKTESTVLVSESATASAEPVRRGRRAATKPAAEDAKVTSEPANPVENDVADPKSSSRSIKWKEALEVIDITPARTARGKRANPGDKADAKSKSVSKDADKTEEKDLSDAVAQAQPVKRARRGAKVAEVTAEEAESASKVVEAETQPKTRRGRSAKK